MKVLKFGGTSVGTIDSLLNVKRIVDALEEPGIVVVSALGGLTDGLISTARMAASGDEGFRQNMKKMAQRHFDIINALVPRERRSEVRQTVAEFLSQLEDIYMGVSLIGCLPDKVLNRIVSFGERMSSIMVANILRDAGHADPLDFIKTKKEYGRDVLAARQTADLIAGRFVKPLPRTVVTGGFISRDMFTGEITNLGRGGSDFTAALIAAGVGADVLEIWTDVDGFMTADPRVVPDARVIENMSYPESTLLCNHGVKVIYTPTIRPVMETGIPMRVLNTHNVTAPGTLIGPGHSDNVTGVCGLACMNDVTLVCLHSADAGHNQISAFRDLLSKHGIQPVCYSKDDDRPFLVIRLTDSDMAESVIADHLQTSDEMSHVDAPLFMRDLSMLTVVGHGLHNIDGLHDDLEKSLVDNGIVLHAVCHNAYDAEDYSEFFVPAASAADALKLLHNCCFK